MHVAMEGPPFENLLLLEFDQWIQQVVDPLETARDAMAPDTLFAMSELIPVNSEWCNASSDERCKTDSREWMAATSSNATPNRKPLGWNAAAAAFAYGFIQLASRGWKYVGADQLVGGVYPDNYAKCFEPRLENR